MSDERTPCAGGIVFDGRDRLLLIQRSKPPSAGTWSLPGGRCLPGESPDAACVRELAEETALDVEIVRWVGRVERGSGSGSSTYVIDDYLCRWVGGTAVAGDDAAAVRWADLTDFDALPLAPGLRDALAGWSMLPR